MTLVNWHCPVELDRLKNNWIKTSNAIFCLLLWILYFCLFQTFRQLELISMTIMHTWPQMSLAAFSIIHPDNDVYKSINTVSGHWHLEAPSEVIGMHISLYTIIVFHCLYTKVGNALCRMMGARSTCCCTRRETYPLEHFCKFKVKKYQYHSSLHKNLTFCYGLGLLHLYYLRKGRAQFILHKNK